MEPINSQMDEESQPQSTKLNRLAKEKSPYLLQHKSNPVDWYPWGPEALERAKKEDKLIFLSVGYSTCHWCHVMAHESFENANIAGIMNQEFVNVKVDREERPDIDRIYMAYVQATQGGGGWPMSVWLTPSLKPVVGGTYFPPVDNYGRLGFPTVCKKVSDYWKYNRDELEQQATNIINQINASLKPSSENDGTTAIQKHTLEKCAHQIAKGYDNILGGFTRAPKFPRPVVFTALFHHFARDRHTHKESLGMALHTLKKMGEGGIYDHVGGGFHRYSVTSDWHVPHFEKMLYDQAQIVNALLDAFQISLDPYYAQKAAGVLDYVIDKLVAPNGGVYCAEDADSLFSFASEEHGEGAFYVWSADEIMELLGSHNGKVFSHHYGVHEKGNVDPEGDPHGEFTGKNILFQKHTIAQTAAHFALTEQETEEILSLCKKVLYAAREKRPRPHLDDKILTAWNGLIISSFARFYQLFQDEKYLQCAVNCATFVKNNLYNANEKYLIRNYREGPSSVHGFCEDYSYLINGLIDLYETTFNLEWLTWAIELQQIQDSQFWDQTNGGYFSSKQNDENYLLHIKEDYDGAEPSANSMSALNLVRLAQLTGEEKYRTQAETLLNAFKTQLSQSPIMMPLMCAAIDYLVTPPMKIVIVSPTSQRTTELQSLVQEIHRGYIANKSIVFIPEDQPQIRQFFQKNSDVIEMMVPKGGKATVYLCEGFTCQSPVNSAQDLATILQSKM